MTMSRMPILMWLHRRISIYSDVPRIFWILRISCFSLRQMSYNSVVMERRGDNYGNHNFKRRTV